MIDFVVDIQNVSKSFRRVSLRRGGYDTLKGKILSFFSGKPKHAGNTRNAIKDITLRLGKGDSVGIIGRNGAGKSTLLKLITGIYKPDTGSINVNGRISALIELGAGFHPDFSGRENVYLSGIIQGLTRKEIDERFDEIVKFAELEQVIDEPIRTYSSGMFMRLGFSLAIHTDPKLLVIDEVLAVGDAAFVAKCKERLAELKRKGTSFILVTHDLDAVERWCDEALWLHEGEIKDRGDPRRVIDHYREFVLNEENQQETARERESYDPLAAEKKDRWGSREIEILRTRLIGGDGMERHAFHRTDELHVEIEYNVKEKRENPVFGIAIERSDGLIVFGTNTLIDKVSFSNLSGKGKIRYKIPKLYLLENSYTVDVAVHAEDGYPYDYHKGAAKFTVRDIVQPVGVFYPEGIWEVANG